jgi:hypothetical protein
MDLLFAQAQPAPQVVDVGPGTYAVWALIVLVGLVSFVCEIIVIVKMFQNDQSGLGILCIVLIFCGNIAGLIAFIVGWVNATKWAIKNLMIAWTVAFLAQFILGGVFATMIISTIQQAMKGAGGP